MFLSLFCHSNSSNIRENLLYGFRSDRRTCKQGQLSNEALYHLTLVFTYCNRVEEPDFQLTVIWHRKCCWVPCPEEHLLEYLLSHIERNDSERAVVPLGGPCTWSGIVRSSLLAGSSFFGYYTGLQCTSSSTVKGKSFACPVSAA